MRLVKPLNTNNTDNTEPHTNHMQYIQHLNKLLNTPDLDVLEAVLRLILRPAQRMSSQRNIRSGFSLSHDKITELARGWHFSKSLGNIELLTLCDDNMEVTQDMATIRLQFFRTVDMSRQHPKPLETINEEQSNDEGVIVITAEMSKDSPTTEIEEFQNLVKEYSIPEEYHFELAHRIRVAKHLYQPELRKRMLAIRLLSIAIMSHTVSEAMAQNRVFMYEPTLIANLANLIHPEKSAPLMVQTAALYALDAIARHRNKLSEVLTAVNASANHGTLLFILRKVTVAMESEDSTYPQDFLDALFAFVTYLIQTQSGGQMLMSAGIIPTLLTILGNKKQSQLKNVTKSVGLLDSIVYGFAASFSAFCNAGGLDSLVNRIKIEVEYCSELAASRSKDSMEDVQGQSTLDAKEMDELASDDLNNAAAPHERTALVKAMFKFVLHMMESSGTADGLRNLIDSSLPQSLKLVVEQPQVFGNSVFALAINVMSTFIHNEPTSLPILQEAKLPQSFLDTITNYTTVSTDVLLAASNAFGAICLNAPGLEMFNAAKPIHHFFNLFTSPQFLRANGEVDVATLLGTSMDELMRHHPVLKPDIIKAVIDMAKRVNEMGHQEIGKPADDSHLLKAAKPDEVDKPVTESTEQGESPKGSGDLKTTEPAADEKDKRDCVLVSFIDVVARFLEGLFQNNSHCRDFTTEGGLEILLDIYSLPMLPGDFAVSIASDSLSYLFRLISEVNSATTIKIILNRLRVALENASEFLSNDSPKSMIVDFIDLKDSEPDRIERANKVFRKLVELHGFSTLLSNICTSPVFSHGKNGVAIVQEFVAESSEPNILLLLGELHRSAAFENFLLRSAVPKAWYSLKNLQKKASATANDHPLGISGFGLSHTDLSSDAASGSSESKQPVIDAGSQRMEPTEVRLHNTNQFRNVLTDMCACLMPIFQGLTKMSVTRRLMDNDQKKEAFKLAELISTVIKDNIKFPRIYEASESCRYSYLASMTTMASLLLMDDRSQPVLQTVLVVTFDRQDGPQCFFDTLRMLWTEAVKFVDVPESDRNEAQKEKQKELERGIETVLNIISQLGSSKYLHDSPYTGSITSKEKDRKNPNFFNPHEWLVAMRLQILPVLREIWNTPNMKQFPKTVVRDIIKNIVQLLKADGESDAQTTTLSVGPSASNVRLTSSIFAPPRSTPVADEAHIQTLIDMGFERNSAEQALIRCNNQISRAIDYLFSHPQPFMSAGISSSTAQRMASNDDATETSHTEHLNEANEEDNDDNEDEVSDDEHQDDDDSDDDEDAVDGAEILQRALRMSMEGPDRTSEVGSDDEDDDDPFKSDDEDDHDAEAAVEKSKNEHEARVEQLAVQRKEFRGEIAEKIMSFIDNREDIIFEIRDLCLVVHKFSDSDRILEELAKYVTDNQNILEDKQGSDERMRTTLRLLALMFRENSVQTTVDNLAPKLIPVLLQMFEAASNLDETQPLPTWLASLCLVLEVLIASQEEPRSVPLEIERQAALKKEIEDGKSLPEAQQAVSKEPVVEMDTDNEVNVDSQRNSMLTTCVKLLHKPNPGKDDLHAILRILARVTRYHEAAVNFVDQGGIQLLMDLPRHGLDGFRGQQAFIVMILRNIIEDMSVIEESMADLITTWFTIPRPRLVDVATFIRTNAHIALREPDAFVRVVERICRLTKYDPSGRTQQIGLAPKSNETKDSGENTSDDVEMTTASETASQTEMANAASTFAQEQKNKSAEVVVNHLVNELMSVRAQMLEPPKIEEEETEENKEEIEKKKTAVVNGRYVYTGFLLQCLVELVSSYPRCKYYVINHNRRRNSKDAASQSNPSKTSRNTFINMLLNDFLPYGPLNPTEDRNRLQYSLSTWTASVLVAMCYDNSNQGEDNEPHKSELATVRKSVLDGVLRSFKDAISATEAVSVQYGKYLAFADLCHRILNATPNSGGPLQKPKEDTPLSIAKIMLDKGFVAVLTNAVSDVDVNYPHAKTVLNALLRPLEQLTKIAIKIERTDEPAKDDKKNADEEHHAEFVAVPETADDDEDEAPDLYRNSALGMYDGSVMEEEDDDEMESDEDEDGFDEDDFDHDTGSDLSEMSDLSDEDDDGEDDMEDDDMMQHHHYHSGMEDDEDEMDEDDEAEMISDGEVEEIIGDDDDDDTDEDEEGGNRELTWQLEDIADQNEPIIRLHTDLDDDDHHHHHHHHRRHADPFEEASDQDDDLNTLDTSDFEDDESENLGDEIEAEIAEGVLDEDILENPFLVPHEIDDGIVGAETDGWARGSRSIGSHRRHNRGIHALTRRGGWETTMPIQLEAVTNRGSDRMPLFDMGSVQVVGRSFRDHPGGASGGNNDEIVTHPLLSNRPGGSGSGDGDGQRARRSHGFTNLQAFEDILGGSAVQVLENLLNNRAGGGNNGAYRVDVYNNGTGQVTSSFELDRMQGSNGPSSGNQRATSQDTEALSALQDFQPMNTSERWLQEGRMLYGPSITDKAGKLFNAVSNVLIPHAIEDDKRKRVAEEKARAEQRRKEEEERRKAEEEQKRKEEEERKLKEEEAKKAAEAASSVGDDEVTVAENASTEEAAESSQAPMTIMINGEEIDISGTGIDIEFLEALPDDLRREVVNQHIQERQPAPTRTEAESISPEFLDALPPEIRAEVLQQEALERERRERQRQQGITSTQASTTGSNSANILTPLDTIANEFEALFAANNTAGESNPFQTRLIRRSPVRLPNIPAAPSTSQSKVNHRKDVIQLVDRAQLATLVRLLFVPQAISKGLLNKLLLNLCENSKSRGDLLSLLICILQDGSTDLAAVDRSFSQLSLQSKSSIKLPKSKSSSSTGTTVVGESVPNLVTQRCLEALIYIVSCNSHTLTYFLCENDHLSAMKKANIKKTKGKEKDKFNVIKYPMVVLMGLLDRPVFTSNSGLMEQLMHFLATICRPLPALVKKVEEKEENKAKATSSTEDQSKDKGKDEAPPTKSEEAGKTEASGSHKFLPKPPVIPEPYIKMVVHVLTTGECSSRTFQYTLNVISHLSALEGAQQVITQELVADASQSGAQIRDDLKELHSVMENTMSGVDIQGTTLTKFSPASSQQAKLLRVLKTIDYMYSRKQHGESKSKDKLAHESAQQNEERILKIYDELQFDPLWKLLGACLAVVHEKEEMINVATVLLPLIEAFMVVSKYVAEKGSQRLVAATPSVEIPDAFEEEFFFRFTEEHKKILNIMVRNNPSLMSGSFSLLVKNPKMLEFDNKRNYFNQQLHKRTNRDHYPSLQLNVRRQYVFEDSYHQLQGRSGDEIKFGKLSVRFYDEEGVDAGGVSREWFSVLARQMFDPNYALFKTSAADKLTYQPNRASWVNPDHLSFFKFVGRVIGKAIYDGRLLDAYFTRSFYKHILGRQVDYRDVEAVDPEYYKSLVWMLENDITDIIDLTFSVETDDFGTMKTVDLKPNGRDIPVTEENKQEYVKLITEQKLTLAIKDQINAFLDGFHDIISEQLISIFNEQELELLISGMPDIDIDDWKNNTEYQGYSSSSPQINWFWRAVRSFDQEERAKLLQFATGTSKVPLEGFAHLQGSGGTQKFQIHCQYSTDRLPSAHTCFNQVDLPQYESYDSLRANLLTAIRECSTGFGFG
ncbi:hypothetical protein NQZ79_g2089 [Umbelopsis isabellina]|nr:hypothetical protein NQZ79_g2089 [Umbelopsis isabellina]